jgi:ADP-heptose:LPS heptosyltransferase
MNIDLVRKIDYWVGIPTCWLLTVANRLIKPLSRRPPQPPEKFLFIELSEMGSAILAYPAMKAVKKDYPSAELFFLIFEKNRASVDILKIIPNRNILVIREKSSLHFLFDCLKVIYRMRREKIDCVFDLELFTRITSIFSYLSAAPIRVGFHRFRMEGLYRGNLHTHWIQYSTQQHISKSFLSFIRVLDYPQKDWPAMDEAIPDQAVVTASYQASESDANSLREKIKRICPEISPGYKLILLNPSAGEIPIRAWPVEKYIGLTKLILSNPQNMVLLIGAGADWETTHRVHQALKHDRCVQFTGQTTFSELMDLFSIADLLITNDSGPAHFASLTGIKNIVFFGPETPRLYAPLGKNTQVLYSDFPCSPCLTAFNHRNTPCRDNKCLQTITLEEVYSLVKGNLGED